MADKVQSKLIAIDEQDQYNWRIGTGFHDKGDTAAYRAATNRTYLVVNVWGYSDKLRRESRRVPEATLTCISARNQDAITSKRLSEFLLQKTY